VVGAYGPRCTRPFCFTLIELLVVLLIMAVLLGVGVRMYGGSTVHHQIEAAADRVQADLALARQSAMATGSARTVQFTPGTGRYTLPDLSSPDRPGLAYSVDLSAPPYEVSIPSADFGGDATICFDAYGRPDSGGSITLQAGDRQITLSVSPDTGRASRP